MSRDRELGALAIIELGSALGVLGYIPSDNKSTAIFKLLDENRITRWAFKQDGTMYNLPGAAIRRSEGYILVSIETDLSASPGRSALILTLLSESGTAINQRRYPISVGSPRVLKTVALDTKGNLVVAVNGITPTSALDSKDWTNPLTGTKRYCLWMPEATQLFSINPHTLDVQDQKIIQDKLLAMRAFNGHLYAAIGFLVQCGLNKHVRLVELRADLKPSLIFQSQNVNSIDVTDLAVTDEYFILVGAIDTFLPITLLPKRLSLEQVTDLWSESFWEMREEQQSALVLVVAKNGTKLGDRIFPDPRSRRIASVIQNSSDHFVAVGNALGDRGWALAFHLTAQLKDAARAAYNGHVTPTSRWKLNKSSQ
jgi:hypothetical protein